MKASNLFKDKLHFSGLFDKLSYLCICDVILYGGILQSYRWFVILLTFGLKSLKSGSVVLGFFVDMGRIDSTEGARKINTLTPMDSQASKMLENALLQMDGIISGKKLKNCKFYHCFGVSIKLDFVH